MEPHNIYKEYFRIEGNKLSIGTIVGRMKIGVKILFFQISHFMANKYKWMRFIKIFINMNIF